MKENIPVKGKVEVFVTEGKPTVQKNGEIDFINTKLVNSFTEYNIIVNLGKDNVITAIASAQSKPIGRMAIGDRGTIPSDPTVPKIPVATMTALFNEVYRADIEATTINIGTPTVHEVKFIKTFSAVDIPITSFSNQAKPVINEVGLVFYDPGVAQLPRTPVAAPSPHLSDETLFSIRTFKSVPFEAANDISVTIRYTIFIE